MSEQAPEIIWAWGDPATDFTYRGWNVQQHTPAIEYRRADLAWLPEELTRRLRDRVKHHDEMQYYGRTTVILRDILAALGPKG